jgi:hypothetical protein
MVPEVKVPMMDANSFVTRFYNGTYWPQRLGQAFCNEFNVPSSDLEGKLFFTQDNLEAIDLIFEHFVEVN